MTLTLAYSPCPNDTFIFGAWANKLIEAPPIEVVYADVQHLNEWACEGRYPISKISFNTLGKVLDDYVLLPTGAALGRGCGPMIIGRHGTKRSEVTKQRIAIPGKDTTAYLLLCILLGTPLEPVFCTYDEVVPLLQDGTVDCGLIIHETRFTYESLGFACVTDLGADWEREYGVAIPLGGIVAKRELGSALHGELTTAMRTSLSYAQQNPDAIAEYIARYSQEKDPQVIQSHIDLYVNAETERLSETGIAAVDTLLREARSRDLLPQSSLPWLADVHTAPLR